MQTLLDDGNSSTVNKNKNFKLQIIVFVIVIVAVAIDQVTKFWALENLKLGAAEPVIGNALQWILVKNPGAAFSLFENATWVFTIISSAVAIAVVVMLRKVDKLRWAIVAGLVLSGAIGNLIDRLFREPGFAVGHVIDFIFTPWIVPAVYNVADIMIVTGMGLFLIFTFITEKRTPQIKEDQSD